MPQPGVIAGGGERDFMNELAVRAFLACLVVFALSSCEAARKFGSDFEKFGAGFRAGFQGRKAPVAKAEKVAPTRPVSHRSKQFERNRQARIPTAVPVDPERIEPAPETKPEPPKRRTALGAVLPRPAPGAGVEHQEAPGYRGQKYKGVANGNGDWRSPDGHRYVGAFRNGKFHGSGVYFWPDGERYEGDFLDGKFQGNTNWSMANGNRYTGEVRDGKFHGKGVFSRPGGERYEGDFRDGKFYGFGDWKMADGNRYVGDVRDDEFHGCGAYIWTNGEYYAGEFQRDRFHGLGSYAWPDGFMKTCEWRDDAEVEGSCVEHTVDGKAPEQAAAACYHTASWRAVLPAPMGAEAPVGLKDRQQATAAVRGGESHEEAKYEGQHRDGKPHGKGALTFANGDRFEGEFADGEIRGRGRMYLANGDVYGGDGAFDSQGYQGCGLYVRANGDRYMGQFRDSRFHGRGTYEWAEGVAATCDWRDGVRVVESCKAHRVTGIGERYIGDGICGTLTDRNVKQRKRWGR